MTEFYGITINEETLLNLFDEQEVLYKDYKNVTGTLKHCPQKKNTYNADTKTIILYVPKFQKLADEIINIYNSALLEIGYDESDLATEGFTMENATEWICKFDEIGFAGRYTQDATDELDIAINKIIALVQNYLGK